MERFTGEELRQVQLDFLQRAAIDRREGKIPYPLRMSRTRERHVLLYGSHTHAFCGAELEVRQLKYEPYCEKTLATVCADCRQAIAAMAEEATNAQH